MLRLSRVLLLLGVDGGVAAAVLLLLGPLPAVPHAPLGVYGDFMALTGLELAGGELTLEQQQPSEHRLPHGWKLNLVVCADERTCRHTVMRSSSSIRPDIKRDKLLRKFSSARHNLQLPSSGVSVGACSDQLQGGKLFNSEEYFQKKISGPEDGGDYNQGEVIVRTLAKKSEDKFKSLGRIIAKEKTFDHADPSSRGNKSVNVVYVMIPY